MWPFSSSNSPIILRKQEERSAALKSASAQSLASIEKYLVADASSIVNNISAKKWTASQVLEAYITRSAQVHEATNCLTEIMYDTARVRAKDLDAEFERTGKVVGPLHGVPMSFKDMFAIKDYDATVGFSQWSYKPCPKSADAAVMLLKAGVIPFVKTSIPQTMLAFECANPLWGRTLNPYSPDYTCGGSSGGEGALLGASGSALGFGSDIGGSLRIPAGMCGVYSLKPSVGRISSVGAMSSNPGFSFITAVVGPMGRSVSDLKIACQVLFGQEDSEGLGSVAPVPFREVSLPKSLKFGYYSDDGFVKSSPANERAVMESVEALRQQGHECIDLTIRWPFGSEPVHIMSSYFSADSYKALLEPVGPDPKDPSLFLAIYPPLIPRFLRTILGWVVDALGDSQFATLLRDARPKSVGEVYDLNLVKTELTKRLHEEIWETHGLDGIICPVGALPSIPHGSSRDLSPIANATMTYNLIDSPVGVLPVTHVDPSKDFLTTSEWPLGERGGSWLVGSKCMANYDPVKMKGLPVGVQIVGRKWEDEKVLAMMDVVDQALGERGFGPRGGAELKLY